MASDQANSIKDFSDEHQLVWVDLEMTGLDTEKDRIMEIAVIVTNGNLDLIEKGPNLIIKVEKKILDNMNEWCQQHHGGSGLTEACRKSNITLSMAEDKVLEFLVKHTEQGKAPLAGNSVHADKKFLDKYMPKVMKHLHYRIVDVSTLKELCRRWYETEFKNSPRKSLCHRALDDIKESINELKYYKSSIFKKLDESHEMRQSLESMKLIPKIDERLVWIDLEMTGLNEEKEKIMEVAVIVTDSNLEIVKTGPSLIIRVEDEILNNMNEWCKQHHGESGLTKACRRSDITLPMAEDKILEFIVQHVEKGKAPLAGNSVHSDKKFLDRYMPKLMKYLHYRIVDVSTLKELCRYWYPTVFKKAPSKKLCHRALDDIEESINELIFYKSTILK